LRNPPTNDQFPFAGIKISFDQQQVQFFFGETENNAVHGKIEIGRCPYNNLFLRLPARQNRF
jgi:hypothetical protein